MTSTMPVTIWMIRNTVSTTPQIHIQLRFFGAGKAAKSSAKATIGSRLCSHFSGFVFGS
jgi:hypothetical protein